MNLRKSLDTCLDMKKLCAHIFSENGGGGSREKKKINRTPLAKNIPNSLDHSWYVLIFFVSTY